MAKIKKINNIANEEILPVTHSDAVIVDETNLTTKLGEMMQVELSESDPGEGEPLEDGKFIAVYGEAEQVATEDIKDSAVTFAKLAWTAIINKIYPVGSVYISTTLSTAAQVQEALGGGTWQAWGSGKVPVGVDTAQTEFNTVGKTGGEKTHKLVENELPKISGSWTIHAQEGGTEFYTISGHATGDLYSNHYRTLMDHATQTGANSYRSPGFAFGNNGSHNNLQPYITCYMYKRTA